eukprot:scaffold71901_cov16-Tisochrysis_lutea.AAC.1
MLEERCQNKFICTRRNLNASNTYNGHTFVHNDPPAAVLEVPFLLLLWNSGKARQLLVVPYQEQVGNGASRQKEWNLVLYTHTQALLGFGGWTRWNGKAQ